MPVCGCVCVCVCEIACPISTCLCYYYYHFCICLNVYTTKLEIKNKIIKGVSLPPSSSRLSVVIVGPVDDGGGVRGEVRSASVE